MQVEEFYVITWEGKKEQIFEMPTGGAAIMRKGPNLLKLARKEQCLALLAMLRGKLKTDGQVYRVFPNGEVQYLHPKDGTYPEKVNKGRELSNANMRRIGQNANPANVRNALYLPACFERRAGRHVVCGSWSYRKRIRADAARASTSATACMHNVHMKFYTW